MGKRVTLWLKSDFPSEIQEPRKGTATIKELIRCVIPPPKWDNEKNLQQLGFPEQTPIRLIFLFISTLRRNLRHSVYQAHLSSPSQRRILPRISPQVRDAKGGLISTSWKDPFGAVRCYNPPKTR